MGNGIAINLKPHDDEVSYYLRNAYYAGAKLKVDLSTPCSLCRANLASDKPSKKRRHFHGSELCNCQLQTYLALLTGESPSIKKPEGEVSLYDGHTHEHNIFEHMEAGGMHVAGVHTAGASVAGMKNTFEKIVPVEFKEEGVEFKLICHIDGFLVFKNTDYVIETKSVRKYTWEKILREKEISKQWYGQIQAYLAALSFQTCYLIIKNRATSDIMAPIRIERNEKFIKERLYKLYQIYDALKTGSDDNIRKEEDHWNASQCKFCRWKGRCWGSDKVKLTKDEQEEEDFITEMDDLYSIDGISADVVLATENQEYVVIEDD